MIEDSVKALLKLLEPIASSEDLLVKRRARISLEALINKLGEIAADLDPVLLPSSVFDPSNPSIAGRIVALALIAQPRQPLLSVQDLYGSGVYAIYYLGEFPAYEGLSRKEHPIYVGKADPEDPASKNPRQQGIKLTARLKEHAKNIGYASSTLTVSDFECRFLIVQTGYQKAAEDYLIRLFRPIWNSETKICFGLGKHGDSFSTRANKRSPWDTLHPGRSWATGTEEDQKSKDQIIAEISSHLRRSAIYGPTSDYR